MTTQDRTHRAHERKLERREYFLTGVACGVVGTVVLTRLIMWFLTV